MKSLYLVILVFLVCLHRADPNLDQWGKSRQKRSLIYANSGVQKLILSFVLTLDLQDKRSWRSLAGAWNLQWQHSLPVTVLHWWNSSYFPAKGRALPPSAPEPVDFTGSLVFATIEAYMNNKGMRGRECLKRSICQNAQVQFVGGLMDQIYKRLMTPDRSMEDHYKDAYVMGSEGVDCYETFGCPKGQSVFDQFVQIFDVD